MSEAIIKKDICWGNKRILVKRYDIERGISNYFYVSEIYWNINENPDYFTDKSYTSSNEVKDIVSDVVDKIRDQ